MEILFNDTNGLYFLGIKCIPSLLQKPIILRDKQNEAMGSICVFSDLGFRIEKYAEMVGNLT